MSILVVFSQPLRQPQAAAFLHSRESEERKVVVTRDVGLLNEAIFPVGTEFHSWEVSGSLHSATTISHRLIARAKTWVRGGSRLGSRVERWLKAGEWRLRYLDRLVSAIKSGQSVDWSDARMRALLQEISEREQIEEIAVLDLFDLPALDALSGNLGGRIRVL